MFKGIGASAGIGIGNVMMISESEIRYEKKYITDTESEMVRYKDAVDKFISVILNKAEKIRQNVGSEEAEILNCHIAMINDPIMSGEIERLIMEHKCSEEAVATVCDSFIELFSNTEQELVKQRAADVKDIKHRMLRILLNIEDKDISDAPKNTILACSELTPSMTAGINKDNIVGIITETGGKTSHSTIIVKALEIPVVLSVKNLSLRDGECVIVDGTLGEIISSPDEDTLNRYHEKRLGYLGKRSELLQYVDKPTVTADGIQMNLFANIEKVEDTKRAIENSAGGIGLFRTEFLYMDKKIMPTEEEQFNVYKQVVIDMQGKSVVIRTLDIGGDKDVPYMNIPKEKNPFLGLRAIRYCLENEDIFCEQLRALLRASEYGEIQIMIPLVTCIDEVLRVKELIKKLDIKNANIKLGVMIETASAVLISDILAKEVDFFSIGTNDLTQYIMSVDRGNSKVEHLYSHYNPAVLRAIKTVIENAKKENIRVGMCGEAAADPLLIPILISFGLDEYSVSTSALLETRKIISMWTKAKADKLTNEVMKLRTKKEVYEKLSEEIVK